MSLKDLYKPHKTKLVLLQIDGLQRELLKKGLAQGRCPHLQSLLNSGNLIIPLYSGLPSSTPGVQAELFYGIKTFVPAFAFYNRQLKQVEIMRTSASGDYIEKQLQKQSVPLLKQGSGYCNIYDGGAQEAHLIPRRFGDFRSSFRRIRRRGIYSILALFKVYLRIIISLPFEFVYAIARAIEGIFHGQSIIAELKLIPTRLIISVYTREVISEGVRQDMRNDQPIIHANFLAYDEAAHRRGPATNFALGTLSTIDKIIGSILAENVHCPSPYKFYIYSDHGQESVIPYSKWKGEDFESIIRREWQKFEKDDNSKVTVCCMGPVALVYFEPHVNASRTAEFARIVGATCSPGGVLYINDKGDVDLVIDGDQTTLEEGQYHIWDKDAIHSKYLREDLEALVKNPHAGDLILLGWRKNDKPVSFADENGAHAGPGSHETDAFLITDDQTLIEKDELRPRDLYHRWLELRPYQN